eukprot:Hpha_TRINITY_DN7813_c0_g1::TRINITY_DN7813_c0_g1_i1::g.185602::m.185602
MRGLLRCAAGGGVGRVWMQCRCMKWEQHANDAAADLFRAYHKGAPLQSTVRESPESWKDARSGSGGTVPPAPLWDDDDHEEPTPHRRRSGRRKKGGTRRGGMQSTPEVEKPDLIWRVVWPAGTAWRKEPFWDARASNAYVPTGSRGIVADRKGAFVLDNKRKLWIPLIAPDGARLTLTLPAPTPGVVESVKKGLEDPIVYGEWKSHCEKYGGGCVDPEAHDEQWLIDAFKQVTSAKEREYLEDTPALT